MTSKDFALRKGFFVENPDYPVPMQHVLKIMEEYKSEALDLSNVMPRFLPQPSEIERILIERGKMATDEFGRTGQFNVNTKDILDLIIELREHEEICSCSNHSHVLVREYCKRCHKPLKIIN